MKRSLGVTLRLVPADLAFTQRVTSATWLGEAAAWLDAALADRGLTRTSQLEQPRVRPWSTLLRANTTGRPVWFKATCASASFEPRLLTTLTQLAPNQFNAPLATDHRRGWLATFEHEPALAERSEPPTADTWRELLATAAELQRVLAGSADQLLAAGLPDHRPETLPARLRQLVDELSTAPSGTATEQSVAGVRDAGPVITSDRADRILGSIDRVKRAADRLAESPFTASWQHGDLHPGNVYRSDGGSLHLFDLGDGQLAHPFEALAVPAECLALPGTPDFDDVIDQYLAAWECDRNVFDTLWPDVQIAFAVNRAATWLACLAEATPEEWAQWGNAPTDYLTRLIEP